MFCCQSLCNKLTLTPFTEVAYECATSLKVNLIKFKIHSDAVPEFIQCYFAVMYNKGTSILSRTE